MSFAKPAVTALVVISLFSTIAPVGAAEPVETKEPPRLPMPRNWHPYYPNVPPPPNWQPVETIVPSPPQRGFTVVPFELARGGPAPGDVRGPREDAFSPVLTTPLPLLYLDAEAVRADLKLSKEQDKKLTQIQKNWVEAATKDNLGPNDSPAARLRRTKDAVKEIDGVLSAGQRTRLQQIIVRHRIKELGASAVYSVLARDLDLSADQRAKHQLLYAKRAETVLEHLTGGERLQSIRRKVYETNSEYAEQFEQMLSPAQQVKLRELLGEPFVGDIRLKDPFSVNIVARRTAYTDELFNCYSFDPDFLMDKAVQQELNMSDQQIRTMAVFVGLWNELTDKEIENQKKNVDGVLTAREINLHTMQIINGSIDNRLKADLDPNQRQRLREIMMQHRFQIARWTGVCGYPGFAESAKLSADQVAKLRSGRDPHEVLDKDQLASLKTAVGEPFKAEVKFNDRGIFAEAKNKVVQHGANGPVFDLKQITLAGFIIDNGRRLNLTKEQTARLQEIADDAPKIREILHKELSQLPPPPELGGARGHIPEVRALETYRKAIEEQCFDALDKRQQSLLRQIWIK